jgi:polyferredoxin
VLILLFFPVYLSGHEGARLLYQVAALVVLGLWLNTLVTEVDLVNLSQGQAASPAENPQRWVLLGFVGVSSLLFGQVWCGYLCPFGAAQELVSRLGRRLGLRAYPERHLEQRARALKFVLLAAMLVAVWVTGQGAWATFNPMQHAFAGRLGGWMPWLTALVLVACLFHYRFWCRYLCPMGAFLALGNKFALLQRLAPKRRFEHCDLGVKGEFDLDCIRCNRCLSGTDTHVRRSPARSAKLVP